MSDLVKRLRNANGWDFLSIAQEGADRIEHLERVLMQAREAMEVAENAARREAIAAIDEALHTEVSEKR